MLSSGKCCLVSLLIFSPAAFAWDTRSPCREALIRFQGKSAKTLMSSSTVESDIQEIVGADSGATYRIRWSVNVQRMAPMIDFNFDSERPAQVSLSFENPEESRFRLGVRLPRGEASALQDLNLVATVLRHINERAVSGEKVEWEINDPNIVDLLNDRLQKIGQLPQIDLPGDVRRASGRVEDDPMFHQALVWDPLSDAYFAFVTPEDGALAIKRINEDQEAQGLLLDALKNSPLEEIISKTGPWIFEIRLVPAHDHLRSLMLSTTDPSDESKRLFPFRYQLVLESF